MNYFLGLDGGGTKTECVLMDAEGHILAESRAGASNPLRIGFAKAFVALSEATGRALIEGHLAANQIAGICAGLAGAGRADVVQGVKEFLQSAFPQAAVRVTTDLEIALEAAVGMDEGVVLIAGTGSAAFGRNAAGKTARAGGEGPEKGDEGSAYDIGRRALEAVNRWRSGTGPATQITDRVLDALGMQDWGAITLRIAEAPDEVYPRLYPLVVNAAEAGDEPAREILTEAAAELGEIAAAVVGTLRLGEKAFVLAKIGGVFGHSSLLDATVDAQITRIAPRARIEQLRDSPARGAAEIARRLVSSG
jgi:N-acetylglucosamine kinase-like BadF-type ATPase